MLRDMEREVGRGEFGGRGWWDKECEAKKEEVRKELRGWRRAGAYGMRYKMAKRKYKELCDRKKVEENERWKKRVAEARREEDV